MSFDLSDIKYVRELIKFQRKAFYGFYKYLHDLIPTDQKKAAKVALWLKKYMGFLKHEEQFNPSYNISYQRGQLVYVSFGFRIGSELGGNHYAVVLDVKNARGNTTLTVVPLKTKRQKETTYSRIYHVDLADAFRTSLANKALAIIKEEAALVADTDHLTAAQNKAVRQRINEAKEIIDFASTALNDESVADIGQICTISKMRIIHPTKNKDILANVVMQDNVMKYISDRIKDLYIGID